MTEPASLLTGYRILPESRAVLNPILRDFTHQFPSKEVLFHEGQQRHFLFAPVNTVADLLRDRHLQARGFWQALDIPGMATLTAAGNPIESTALAGVPLRPAPKLGQHNLEIYVGELGLSPHQLGVLKANHVI